MRFVINYDKSELQPQECIKFLGIDLCFKSGRFHVPRPRLASLEAALVHAAAGTTATPREIYSIAGKIGSMALARGRAVCALYTREMYSACAAAVHGRTGWDTPITTKGAVTEELAFWYALKDHSGGAPFEDDEIVPTVTLFTDASDTSVGAFNAGSRARREQICRVDLPAHLVGTSSTLRELWGVLQCLRAFIANGTVVAGDTVGVGTDSQCAFYGVDRACSRTPVNHSMIKNIYEVATAAGIKITIFWVPREQNSAADAISKVGDRTGYGLAQGTLRRVQAAFGRHDVDGFASALNTTCPAYVTRWLDPDAESTDAFRADWSDGRRWYIFPPTEVADRVVRKAVLGGGTLTLVLPEDAHAPWFRVLFPKGEPIDQVKGWRRIAGREIQRGCASARQSRLARATPFLALNFVSGER